MATATAAAPTTSTFLVICLPRMVLITIRSWHMSASNDFDFDFELAFAFALAFALSSTVAWVFFDDLLD